MLFGILLAAAGLAASTAEEAERVANKTKELPEFPREPTVEEIERRTTNTESLFNKISSIWH